MMDCRYSQKIAPYVMDDLPASQRREVGRHLDDCDGCRREKEALEQTFGALTELEDVPAPHHFFVPRQDPHLSLVQAWTRLSGRWKSALAASLTVLLAVVGLSTSGLRVEVEQGVLRAGFGEFQPQAEDLSQEGMKAWTDHVLSQVEAGLTQRDRAWAATLSQVRLLDQRLHSADEMQQRRLRSLAADLKVDLTQAWQQDDQQSMQQMEQWVSQAYVDLRIDYLRRLSAMDANLQQIAQRDSALDQKVSILGEALAYTLDQRQPKNIGE